MKKRILIISISIFILVLGSLLNRHDNISITRQLVSTANIVDDVNIVYDNLTYEELVAKFDRVMTSNLAGKADLFVSHSLEMEIDPYIALAIVFQETGCYYGNCSYAVKYKNNIGGMMGRNGLLSFSTIDEGIISYIDNLAYNYFYLGYNTPELMNKKYASDTLWAVRVNNYVNIIKNA